MNESTTRFKVFSLKLNEKNECHDGKSGNKLLITIKVFATPTLLKGQSAKIMKVHQVNSKKEL